MEITDEQRKYLTTLLQAAGISPGQVTKIAIYQDPRTPNPMLYEAIEDEILNCGGLNNFHARLYRYLLDKHNNVAKAGRILDIHRSKIDRRLKQEKANEEINFVDDDNNLDDCSPGD